jgi:hypothetical protein
MMTEAAEIESLKLRVAELERVVSQLQAQLTQQEAHFSPTPVPGQLSPIKQILTDLRARGIIRSPTPAELALSTAWQALPATEQEAVRQKLRTLTLDPPLSEIIHKMRAGWYPDQSEWVTEP